MAYKVQSNRAGYWQEIQVPFIVATPKPYIVDLAMSDDAQAQTAKLISKVGLLRKVMARLDLSEQEAYELGLTLNEHTVDLLRSRAMSIQDYDTARLADKLSGHPIWRD